MTLIEVLAGLVVLSTLLVGVVIASARLRGATARVGLRTEAVAAADALIAGWWADREKLPRSAEGDLPGRPGWRWLTRRKAVSPAIEGMDAEVVVVEIFGPDGQPDRPDAWVELVLPGQTSDEKQADNQGPDAD